MENDRIYYIADNDGNFYGCCLTKEEAERLLYYLRESIKTRSFNIFKGYYLA